MLHIFNAISDDIVASHVSWFHLRNGGRRLSLVHSRTGGISKGVLSHRIYYRLRYSLSWSLFTPWIAVVGPIGDLTIIDRTLQKMVGSGTLLPWDLYRASYPPA